MKKILFLLISIIPMTVVAQGEYSTISYDENEMAYYYNPYFDAAHLWGMYYEMADGQSLRPTFKLQGGQTSIDGQDYYQVVTNQDTLLYRQEGQLVYLWHGDSEHVVLDYGLEVGDTFQTMDSVTLRVVDVDGCVSDPYYSQIRHFYDVSGRAQFYGSMAPHILELESEDGNQKDIWIEGIGSVYWGVVPLSVVQTLSFVTGPITYSHVVWRQGGCGHSDAFWDVNGPNYKIHHFELTERDYPRETPPLEFSFVGNTLCIRGSYNMNRTPCFAECQIHDNVIDLVLGDKSMANGRVPALMDIQFTGFEPGTYSVGIKGKEHRELVCTGASTEPVHPMLEGNPLWIHQQHDYRVNWKYTSYTYEEIVEKNLYNKVNYSDPERSFIYTFLYGKREMNGHEYQVAWQIDSRDINGKLTRDQMHEVLLVREEDGRVLAPYEQFATCQADWSALGILGDEVITNDYTLSVGDSYLDKHADVDHHHLSLKIDRVGTLVGPDYQERQTWYADATGTTLEQVGSLNPLYPSPFATFLCPAETDSVELDEHYCTLNSMYQDGHLVYRAPYQYTHTWYQSDDYFVNYGSPYNLRRQNSYLYYAPPHLQQVLDFIATLPADAIITPSADKHQEAPIYDLQGRRLGSKPRKGMYIQGGKKVMR